MNLPENDYQIMRLTDAFYNEYSGEIYREILKKRKRAYNCLLFESHYDYFICIPFRTEVSHKYAYHFKTSKRSRKHKSGLDYSKIIIVDKGQYLENRAAVIDKDEFKETMQHLEKIKKEALTFVEDYILHMKGIKLLHASEFDRRYRFSTLKYFHEILMKDM